MTYANHRWKQAENTKVHLLDVVAVTALGLAVIGPGLAAKLTADAATSTNTNGLAVLDVLLSLSAMDGHQMTSQVVLATERATTGLVVAGIRLSTVGIMGLDMGLQVEGTCKG